MKRESGYYWIRLSERIPRDTVPEWEVAYYDDEGWYSIWDGGTYNDDEVKEIDERRIIRNENQANHN